MTDYTKVSLQSIFNKVSKHLITQGKRAVDHEGDCTLYDPQSGMRCAYGCLIPKSEYSKDTPYYNKIWQKIYVQFPFGAASRELMNELMECHDEVEPSRWPQRLRRIAHQWNLEIPNFLKESQNHG